jgi:hypothetical protein
MLLGSAHIRDGAVWVLVLLDTGVAARCEFSCLLDEAHEEVSATCDARYDLFGVPSARKPFMVICAGEARSVRLVSRGGARSRKLPVRCPEGERRAALAVCVGPTYRFTRAGQMQTFLDWYRHAGASRVFLYNHSWTPAVDDVVRRYADTVVVFDWKFAVGAVWPDGYIQSRDPELAPIESGGACWSRLGEVAYNVFQFLQMNHCLGQAFAGGFSFAANVDLDELLWNWRAPLPVGWLLTAVLGVRRPDLCAWQARNRFVDTCEAGAARQSPTVFPSGQRSKDVWVVDRVEQPQVHFVQRCAPGTATAVAAPAALTVMHMRYGWDRGEYTQESPVFAELMRRFCPTS